ncbi:MAG: hypothetical protein ACFFCJ_02525 [Promethearchaeota archaeon]
MPSDIFTTADPAQAPPRGGQTHSTVYLWHPTIQATPISSKAQLHHLLTTEYCALTNHPHYPKLLADAERHMAIINHLQDRIHLQHGDIAKLVRTLGVTRTIIYHHVREALKPRLYWYLENAISKTQAHTTLAQIHDTNTGIHTMTDLQDRLTTYYPAQYLTHARGQPDRLTQCTKYFHVLALLAEGGHTYTNLAHTAGKTVTNIKEWCTNKARPGLLNLARRIPTTPPAPDNQWLPLTMKGRFHPTHFIQIPTTITDWNQIPPVLHQLTPLSNSHMTTWHHQFGPTPTDDAFAYLLGNLVSDAGKITPHYTSTRLELNLSLKYDWSQQLGDAVCYYLGLLGIRADYKTSKKCHRWRSQNSPLLTWIQHTLLGIEPKLTKIPIKASWLLKTPYSIRLRFLQGIADGDGWAMTKYQKVGIASTTNCEFIKDLLNTFLINSRINGPNVVIVRRDSINLSSELPFFLHAKSRQENLEKIVQMLIVRSHKVVRTVPQEIKIEIIKLSKQGKSVGEIVETIFDKHNFCFSPKTVRKIIKNNQ